MARRDWTAARAKVDTEGRCRVCGRGDAVEAAHVISRRHDQPGVTGVIRVRAVDVVPLCGPFPSGCHGAYDAHTLDLLPYLSREEQAAAVGLVGLVAAYRRVIGRAATGAPVPV